MHSVTKKIIAFNKPLLPEMVQLKYQIMSENMYRFYRGTCHLFYQDLSRSKKFDKSPLAWICGDLHLENFGSYKGNNGLVYFDLNDFDEGLLAPASWEVARLVTSIFIAFRSLKIEQEKAVRMAQLFLKTYSATLSEGKPYHIERKIAKGIVRNFLSRVSRRKKKELLEKRTEKNKKRISILIDDARHFELDKKLKKELYSHIMEWLKFNSDGPYNYKVIDASFRLAGTGSVGVKRYVFLLRSLKVKDKYLLVDMKQSRPSSLSPYVAARQPKWNTEAERIAAIQKRMQNIPPMLLSHSVFKGEPYLIQEMHPVRDSINFKLIRERYRDIYQVIDDMAMLTASAQLRSSGRQGSANTDELIKFGKNEKWQTGILNYALKYSAAVNDLYEDFAEDFRSGILAMKLKDKK